MRFVLPALAVACLLALSAQPGQAQDLASMHSKVRVGGKLCFADHSHSGSSSGQEIVGSQHRTAGDRHHQGGLHRHVTDLSERSASETSARSSSRPVISGPRMKRWLSHTRVIAARTSFRIGAY